MGHITKSVGEGFRFAISVKRIIPYLIIDLIIIFSLISFMKSFIGLTAGRAVPFSLILFLGIYVILFIIIGLVNLWINGAIIDQARYYPRERSLGKSFEVSTSRYLTMLATAILSWIITSIVSYPPYIGFLLSFIVGLIFFYLYPAIIIDKKRCIDSFKKSFQTFMTFPLETFVTWILAMIISFIILGIFLLPLIFYFAVGFVSTFGTIGSTVDRTQIATEIIPMIGRMLQSPYIIPYIFIFTVGLAFCSVFYTGTQSRLYVNFKKREM